MIGRLFYGPADALVACTNARQRRAVGFWIIVLAAGPGSMLAAAFPNAVWLVQAMSLVALVLGGWALFAAETPVEGEGG